MATLASGAAGPVSPTPSEPVGGPPPNGHGDGRRGARYHGSAMLRLPQRGDVIARWGWLVGVVLYVVLAFVFMASLVAARERGTSALDALRQVVGFGEQTNLILTLLVLLSVAVTVVAASYVLKDVRLMRDEEDDITFVEDHGAEGVRLVMIDAKERADFLRGLGGRRPDEAERRAAIDDFVVRRTSGRTVRVDSMLDSRVQLAQRAIGDAGHPVSAEELRLIAEKRTAAWGAISRYASSLLLLFAVLGTFAGVKAALPGLIDAVQAADRNAVMNLGAPLRAVADAFGGNALALIGAIALGVMSQAVTLGRRNLLERLEWVSAEYVYRDEVVSTANPLASAVEALNRAARDIRASNGQLLGIEGGLEGLTAEFKRSFGTLEERLLGLADRHESDLYGKTSRSLHALSVQVAELTRAVKDNAGTYTGLVDQVGREAADSRGAVERLGEANRELAHALSSIGVVTSAAQQTFADVQTATSRLTDSAAAVRDEVAALTEAVQQSTPALLQVDQVVKATLTRAETLDRQAAESWRRTAEDILKTLEPLTRAHLAPATRGSGDGRAAAAGGAELAPLLRQISRDLQDLRERTPSPLLLVWVPALGALVAAATVVYFLR